MLSKFAAINVYYICHSSLSKNSTSHTCAPRNSDLKIIRIFTVYTNQALSLLLQISVTRKKPISNSCSQLTLGKANMVCQRTMDFQTRAILWNMKNLIAKEEHPWCVTQSTFTSECTGPTMQGYERELWHQI